MSLSVLARLLIGDSEDPVHTHDLLISFLHYLSVLDRADLPCLGRPSDLNHFLGDHRLCPEGRDRHDLRVWRHLDTLDTIGVDKLHLIH